MEVRLTRDGSQINIVAGRTGRFESLSERSDGLRQFVALSTFLALKSSHDRDVILLLDEAEVHLHYDAQADLIQMFNRQGLARKVIYSTHSFACLPEDLGSGIRFAQPVEEDSTSIISNKFWAQGTVGLSPVLFGMGAATMAFLPVRYCVLVEGASDVILLPALLRDANDVEALGFQVSPGLAEAGEDQLALIRNEGARVLYLVDGDDAGEANAAKIKASGVPESRVLQLNKILGRPCVLEDFVEKSAYVQAINEELGRVGRLERIDVNQVSEQLRSGSVEVWAASNGICEISKVNIAYGLLEQRYNAKSIVGDNDGLQKLYTAIRAELKLVP